MKLELEEITTFTNDNPRWEVKNDSLVGEWRLADFAVLRVVIAQLCDLADELNHHPTVTYGYNSLTVETTTHDEGNVITEKDVELAKRINDLVGE